MPVYTYRCDSCGVQFERHQSFQDEPLKTCPECHRKSLKKVITPTRVIFKGSGFYQTDYRSESYRKSASADKPAGEGSSGGGQAPSGSRQAASARSEA